MDRLRYVAVALVAGTVGAAVALLLAPDSGRNTRRKLRRHYEHERQRMLREARHIREDAEEYVEQRMKEGRRAIEGVAEDLGDRLQDGKKKISKMVG